MTYLRTAAAWAASWSVYVFGDLTYRFLDAIDVPLEQESACLRDDRRLSRFERLRIAAAQLLYPLYNWSMIGSNAIQEWGGGRRGPWPFTKIDPDWGDITEQSVADDEVPAEVEPRT